MRISEQFKKQYSEYLKSYLPQVIFQNENFDSDLSKYFDELVELSSTEVCALRKKALGTQCEVSDLAERIVYLKDGRQIVAGARFKNLDIRFPFVEVHKAFDMSSSLVAEIQALLVTEFKSLRPRGFKFKERPNIHLSQVSLEKWSHTVFGEIETNQSLQFNTEISFEFSKSFDWYSQYVAEYNERLIEKKELAGYVRIGQIDEFQESAKDDGLLLLRDTGGFCGVISGIKSPIYGLPAFYMIESYLSKRWVGKKLAPLAHRYLLNCVAPRFKYVWGTIYDKNLSSLRTALRTGREIVETEYFVPFSSTNDS